MKPSRASGTQTCSERCGPGSGSGGISAAAQCSSRIGIAASAAVWIQRQTSDGRSLRTALEFLVPYAVDGQTWPYEQINGFRPDAVLTLLEHVREDPPNKKYVKLAARAPAVAANAVDQLTGVRLVPNEQDQQ